MKSTASCAARKAVLFAELSGGSRGTATAVPPCLIHIITDIRTEGVGARSGMSAPAVVSLLLHRLFAPDVVCSGHSTVSTDQRALHMAALLHAPDDLVDIFDMIPFHVSADAV